MLSEISRLGLVEEIQLLGWKGASEIRRELAHCRALVVPSLAEGLPVVIMEAMAMHTPVVSTYVAGIPELVDKDVGWLVTPGDPESLSSGMAGCLEAQNQTLTTMGVEAALRVRASHRSLKEASKLIPLFQREL